MSDIPRARELIEVVLQNYALPPGSAGTLKKALSLMTREPPIRRARGEDVKITATMRAMVRQMSANNITQSEIARRVGLRNAGRVSEILNGKR